jgi:hypothetical protein
MLQPSKQSPRGTVMVLALMFVAALTVMCFSFSSLTVSSNNGVENTEARTQAYLLAQAGLADEVKRMNAAYPVPIATPIAPLAWGQGSNAQQGYYVDNISAPFVLPDGNVCYSFRSHGVVSKQNIGLNTINDIKRHLEAYAEYIPGKPTGLFPMGAFGRLWTNVVGNSIADSYDSALATSYAQQVAAAGGAVNYHKTPNGNGGNVGSNGPISGVGNMVVYGNATPGPGYSVSLTSNAKVTGSTTSEIAAAVLPDYTYTPPAGSNGSISGTTTINNGTFHYSSISLAGNSKLTIQGTVNIYIDGNFSVTGNAQINLAAGAVANIYQGAGGSTNIAGNGLVSIDNIPSNFNVISASTSSVKTAGNGTFFGTVYAPYADVQISGNGDTFGSQIGKTVLINGNGNFHWDKNSRSPAFKSNPKAVLKAVREIIIPNDSF